MNRRIKLCKPDAVTEKAFDCLADYVTRFRGGGISVGRITLKNEYESPLRGEKPDFWPVSKFNTGSLPLRGNPAGKQKHHLEGNALFAVPAGYCNAHMLLHVSS